MIRRPAALLTMLALTVLSALAAAPAAGQGAFDDPFGAGTADQGGEKVTVSAAASAPRVSPSGQLAIAVVLDFAEGWHAWPSAEQDVLPEAVADFAIRTDVRLLDAPAWVASVGPVQWPAPEPAPVPNIAGDGPKTIEVPTYKGRAIAYVPLILADDAPTGEATLTVEVTYQACDDATCLAPETKTLEVPVTVAPIEEAGGAPGDPSLFEGFDPSVYARMQAGEVAVVDSSEDDGAAAPAGGSSERTFFGIPIPDATSPAGVVLIALLAAVGGFILNLTPCVLPVIPIKIMTISQHAGSPGRSLTLGLWMALGVVAFWFGIGVPVALLSTVTDPSRVFGIWWVTLGIGLLIGAMGVGIMGLFTINLPRQVYAVNPKADSAGGSFLFGVMTAVLGLPCFGFVAGALLAGSATLPPATVMVIFASLGVGMAAPYLVLSAAPRLVDRIPRTGPASELVKQVMGLLLLAAAAYFVGSGLIALVTERPWLGKQLHWWAVALFAALAGLWLLVRTVQITEKTTPRAVFGVVAVLIGGAAVLYAYDSTATARENYQERRAALEASGAGEGELVTGVWIDYSEDLLAEAREAGYTVVLDFTAEWCLNCKALKAAVLNKDPVKSALRSEDVVTMTVDLTSTKAPGWEKLRSLGETGIPLLVVYGPGLEEPWKANSYGPRDVLDALADAGAGERRPSQASAGPGGSPVPR